MTFRETFYQVKRLMESRLHDFGLESANADTMGWTTMLSIKENTRVTIDVPLILIYSDEFLISGTLETSTYSRLNGKTVKLKVGNTIVATTTTNINGEYSFTHIPMSTGNHSFQVIFEGTNIYSASQSSVVNRTVDKETSVMNLNGISIQHYGDTVIFGGQLLDDDGQYISNASVKYYLNNSLVTALTTDAQGRFSTSKSVDSFATQNVKFIYDGDNNYTNCEGSIQINVSQPQLSLTSDKNILSKADNEYATLEATLTENINGTPISFMAYKSDNSLFSKLEFNSSTNEEYEDTTFAIEGDIIKVDFSNISDYAALILRSKDNNLLMFEYSDNNISIMENLETSNAEEEYINIDDNVAIIDLSDNLLNDEYKLRDEYNILYGPYVQSTGDNLVIKSNAELIDTVNTDEDGIATITYHGKGKGDLYIIAKSNNINSNSVTIEDCIDYQPMTSNTHQSRWTIPSEVTNASIFGYSSNGWKFGNASSYSYMKYNNQITNNFVIEFEVTEINDNSAPALVASYFSGSTNNGGIIFDRVQRRLSFFGTNFPNIYSSLSKYKIVVTPNSQELFVDDVSIAYTTVSLPTPLDFYFSTGGNRSITIKDFKIKPLL